MKWKFNIADKSFMIESGLAECPLLKINGFKPFYKGEVSEDDSTDRAAADTILYYSSMGKLSDMQSELEFTRNTKPLHEFDFSDNEEIHCALYRQDARYYFTMHPSKGQMLLSIAQKKDERRFEVVCNWEENKNAGMLRFSLWMGITMALLEYEETMFHSSVIVYKGQAVMCLGESGTGKSTHTRLWRENITGSHLLNDDSPIVKIVKPAEKNIQGNGAVALSSSAAGQIEKIVEDNSAAEEIAADSSAANSQVEVFGGAWSGKTPCFKNEHYPLKAIIRIVRAKQNKITRLSTLNAFGAIYPSCPPALEKDTYFEDKICDILSSILENIPVYTLECLPNADAAYTSFNEIFRIK